MNLDDDLPGEVSVSVNSDIAIWLDNHGFSHLATEGTEVLDWHTNDPRQPSWMLAELTING